MTATDVREVRGDMPLERIEAELTELAGQLAAGECRRLLLVGEYDGREACGASTIAPRSAPRAFGLWSNGGLR